MCAGFQEQGMLRCVIASHACKYHYQAATRWQHYFVGAAHNIMICLLFSTSCLVLPNAASASVASAVLRQQ